MLPDVEGDFDHNRIPEYDGEIITAQSNEKPPTSHIGNYSDIYIAEC